MRLFWPGSLLALFGAGAQARDMIDEPEMKAITLRTHSFAPPFLDTPLASRWYDFGGDTIIRTDSYVRLTSELPSRAGWLFSKVPLTATNWEIEVEFKITGSGTLYGDGMAIWLTKQRSQGGQVFGFMDKFDGLGIFIDTYKNDRPGVVFPYVMAMMGDGHTPYDKAHDGKENELAGCAGRNVRNNAYPTKIKMTYLHDKSLLVQLATDADPDRWERCFNLTNVRIPSVAYLGFSAETGELADAHDIIKIDARNLYNADGSRPGGTLEFGKQSSSKKKNRGPKSGSGGGWGWFFFKFIIFGLVLAGGWAGFVAYRAQKSKSRF